MAAYCRVYDSRQLQADCQEPGSAPEHTLGNRMGCLFKPSAVKENLLWITKAVILHAIKSTSFNFLILTFTTR